ncbi:uncharacterized protein LOC134636998 [Pelmatolapia mariae]|uniref:uncharacterized protein LOC134636998 n=1 Tax=Pelmatolapia mariae TaxID=158779 RepID=UPI003211E59A
MYPSHVQYVELLRTVLLSFPFLKESYGSGYDALHESLRNKFKKERRPLVDVEEIEKMRQKYSVPNSGRKRSSDVQPCIILKKKNKDILLDERSTDQHVSVIKQECQKTRPNVDVIRTHLRKIQKYRTHYILQHTTEEVLREFPCLTIPVVLLEEASMLLKTDVDKKVIRGFSKLAAKLVSIAPNSNLKSLCLKSVDESQTDTERKGQIVNTAVLLLPSIFKENASHLFVINKDPHSPIPTIVLSSSDGKPLSDSTEVNVQMDGQKMILDSGEMDISLAMGEVYWQARDTHRSDPYFCVSDETAYRAEVQRLSDWCADNNLDLSITKTKEPVVDFRRRKSELQPISINRECVERVSSFIFLGVHIDTDLQWSSSTSVVLKKAQQRLHFLRSLRKMDLKKELLTVFYRCSIESVLTYCICVWFSSCTTAHKKALQRLINMAQKIVGHPLPSLKDLYSTRCLKRARSILRDCTHPGHRVFKLLPAGRRFRLLRSGTNRLKDSFYNRATALINANS